MSTSHNDRDIAHDRCRILAVTVGKATIPYCGLRECWVKIGGKKISSKLEAIAYAKKLNAVLRK